ncbi:hypothetical protein NPIL_596951 [Nephila pilipes]|uniref:Uncharacterized protein n=1 Tax=Nephila pilipes TaxID=299642 RepID=A0A8X6Q5M5_NEPPI|nr:hypothetical protein NPIL_596951 [Nephila pilipes]
MEANFKSNDPITLRCRGCNTMVATHPATVCNDIEYFVETAFNIHFGLVSDEGEMTLYCQRCGIIVGDCNRYSIVKRFYKNLVIRC